MGLGYRDRIGVWARRSRGACAHAPASRAAQQYDVIEKFHDCDYELRDTGAIISYVLDSQS